MATPSLRLPYLLQTSRLLRSHHRHFTTAHLLKASSSSKPIVLEQPDAFRPPSHGATLRKRKKRLYYGRELTDEDKKELSSKQYPFSFPPENTFMHWFLTNRSIHVYITLSVLFSLVFAGTMMSFHKDNRFPEMLPPAGTIFLHPIKFIKTYIHVWRLNAVERTNENKAAMARNAEDVKRRAEFRRAHGIPETTGLGAWLGLGTVEEEERLAEVERERVRKLEEERERIKEERKEKGGAKLFGLFRW